MSFRTALNKTIANIKVITGPTRLDIRPHQLTIRKRTWSGESPGQIGSTYTDVDLVLPQIFKIRQVNIHEVAESGGNYQTGDVIVEHITPSDGAGTGFTPTQLRPLITGDNQERLYVITGDGGLAGTYNLLELRSWRPFSYDLVLTLMT